MFRNAIEDLIVDSDLLSSFTEDFASQEHIERIIDTSTQILYPLAVLVLLLFLFLIIKLSIQALVVVN